MADELQIDHLSDREKYIATMLHTSIAALSDRKFADETVSYTLARLEEFHPKRTRRAAATRKSK